MHHQDEATDPDVPTLKAILMAARTAADASMDCQVRLSRVERLHFRLPVAALLVALAALLLSCAAVLR